MRKKILYAMLILCCIASVKASAQTRPKSIVVFDGFWLGSTANGEWKSAAAFFADMDKNKDWVQAQWAIEYPFPYPWGGEGYAIYDSSGYLCDAEGEGLHQSRDSEPGDRAAKVEMRAGSQLKDDFLKRTAYLGVSGLEGDPDKILPRKETALSTKNTTYEKIIKDWLANNGLPDALPNISQLFKVDLEGDGVDEVVIVAQNILDTLDAKKNATFWKPDVSMREATSLLPAHAKKGMYSVVLLRKIVNGKVREIPLKTFVAQADSTPGKWVVPEISRVYRFVDLDGDGALEIVTGSAYYEGCGYDVAHVQAELKTIQVSNAREFLEALGSNRIIEMRPGRYNLSEWDQYLNYAFKSENPAPRYPNLEDEDAPKLGRGVSWSTDPFDGGEVVLSGINNLTICGPRVADGIAEIVVDPRYAFVLRFVLCDNITIERVTAGHSEGGHCLGGVFSFENSSRISITGTDMYGCGTEGLMLLSVSDMKIADSQIYDCTYQIMTITGGRNISFYDCTFRDNREYSMINVGTGSKNISFTRCRFVQNDGTMFAVDDSATDVAVTDSSFTGNSDKGIADSRNVSFIDCRFD